MDAWLAQLSRLDHAEDPETVALRRALLDAEKQELLNENTEHDWERLKFAIKREESAKSSGILNSFRYTAQAAVVLMAVLGVYFMLPDGGGRAPSVTVQEEPVMRGKNIQELYSRNIKADAELAYQRLIKLGVGAKMSVSPNRIEIRMELTYPLSEQARDFLHEQDIAIPNAGELYLVYVPAARLN